MGDVEHSYNYIELLCVLYFGTSGHNTDLNNYLKSTALQKGSTSAIIATEKKITDFYIKFPIPFNSNPKVVAGFYSTTEFIEYGNMTPMVSDVSKTGFTVRIANNSSRELQPAIYWIAME